MLGFRSQQQFNHVRRQLERARNRDTGVLAAVPDFESIGARLGPAERSRREKEFLQGHILVVPEWGGIKWPSGSWTYSRRMCEAIRDRGVAGNMTLADINRHDYSDLKIDGREPFAPPWKSNARTSLSPSGLDQRQAAETAQVLAPLSPDAERALRRAGRASAATGLVEPDWTGGITSSAG